MDKVLGKGRAPTYAYGTPKTSWATTFYRLKMVDLDGSFDWSSTEKIVANANEIQTIWHNSLGQWSVQFSSKHSAAITCQVMGLSGRLIQKVLINLKGNQPTTWELPNNLADGIYLISLELDGKKVVKKLAIHH
jgi:hypothetical protein